MRISGDISGSKVIQKKTETPVSKSRMPLSDRQHSLAISKEANFAISSAAKARVAIDSIPEGYQDAAKLLDTLKNNPDYAHLNKILDKYALVYIEGQKYLDYDNGIKVFEFLKNKNKDRLSNSADLINKVFQSQRINDLALVFDRIKDKNIYQLSFPFYEIENYGLKNTYDLAEIIDYVNKKPQLNSSYIDLDELSYFMEQAAAKKEIVDFKPEKIKPYIDKLADLAQNTGKKAFEQVEATGLYNKVFLTNGEYVAQINPESLNVLKEFVAEPETENLVRKLLSEAPDFITDKSFGNGVLQKNIKIIKDFAKAGLFQKKIDIAPLLTFQGDLEKLLEKLANAAVASRLVEHETKYIINPETSRVLINDSNTFIDVYDREMNSLFSEIRRGASYGDKYVFDTQVTDSLHNFYYKVNEYSKIGSSCLTLSDIVKKNSGGKEILSENDIDGIYDYYKYSQDGMKIPLIQSTKDAKGVSYEKNLESFDGTTSHVKYKQASDKTFETFDYVIKDKKNNILGEKHVSVKKVAENLYEHKVNGAKYLLKHTGEGISIFNIDKGVEKIIDCREIVKDNKKDFLALLKSLWADELEVVADKVKSINEVSYLFDSHITQSGEKNAEKTAKITCSPQMAVFVHELGHEKYRELTKNTDFLKIFNEECRLFKENMPPVIQEMVAYFIQKIEGKSIPAEEAAAEANVILNSPFFLKQTCSRTHFLQKYFPRTIAFVMQHRYKI